MPRGYTLKGSVLMGCVRQLNTTCSILAYFPLLARSFFIASTYMSVNSARHGAGNASVYNKKLRFYIAQYLVRWTAQSALH